MFNRVKLFIKSMFSKEPKQYWGPLTDAEKGEFFDTYLKFYYDVVPFPKETPLEEVVQGLLEIEQDDTISDSWKHYMIMRKVGVDLIDIPQLNSGLKAETRYVDSARVERTNKRNLFANHDMKHKDWINKYAKSRSEK